MGCGNYAHFSDVTRDLKSLPGGSPYLSFYQSQIAAQQQGLANLNAMAQQLKQQQMEQLDRRLYGSPYKPDELKRHGGTPNMEGMSIDDVPVIAWLKHKIDNAWHRGVLKR
jgi:hypothetical protein